MEVGQARPSGGRQAGLSQLPYVERLRERHLAGGPQPFKREGRLSLDNAAGLHVRSCGGRLRRTWHPIEKSRIVPYWTLAL